jgi:hypothetical protein
MPLAANDDMIVDHNAKQASGFGDAVGDLDVCAAGFWTSARVVLHQNQRAGPNVECLPDDFARVDCCLVD